MAMHRVGTCHTHAKKVTVELWRFQSEMPGRSVSTGSQDFSVGECQSQQGMALIEYPTSPHIMS